MFRVHPNRRLCSRWLAPAAMCAVVAGLMVGSVLSGPAEAGTTSRKAAASLSKAKPLKTLPAFKAGVKQASMPGMVSPYARAAARRNESGRLPPGHPYVPLRSTTDTAGHTAQ
jgi:hypothetical protein